MERGTRESYQVNFSFEGCVSDSEMNFCFSVFSNTGWVTAVGKHNGKSILKQTKLESQVQRRQTSLDEFHLDIISLRDFIISYF